MLRNYAAKAAKPYEYSCKIRNIRAIRGSLFKQYCSKGNENAARNA